MATLTHEREAAAAWLKDSRSEAPALPIEKMPQLNASLERFSESVGDALSGICGAGVSGSTERISTTTTVELFGAYRGYPAVIARSAALDARAMLILDNRIVEIMLNAIFGVDPAADATMKVEERPLREPTELESRLVGGFAKALISCLGFAFSPVASFDLSYESLNTIGDVNLLGPREMPAIMAQYTVKTRAGAFRLIVVLPQTATTPLAEMFSRGPDPDAAKADPQWTARMERGVTKAKLDLVAILDDFEMSLGDVAGLRVGSVLPLSNAGEGYIRIECVERGVFLCRLGERKNRYALEIEDIIANNPDDEYYVAG